MISAKTIRKCVGVAGFLVIIVPLTGFPQDWKDGLTIVFGAMVLLAVLYKPIVVEISRLVRDIQSQRKHKRRTEEAFPSEKAERDESSLERNERPAQSSLGGEGVLAKLTGTAGSGARALGRFAGETAAGAKRLSREVFQKTRSSLRKRRTDAEQRRAQDVDDEPREETYE